MKYTNYSDEELAYIIQNDKSQENDVLIELIDRHSGIYHKIVNGFCGSGNPYLDQDLLKNSKSYVIYDSALTFNPKKETKLSTFIGNNARFFCLNHMNKERKKVKVSDVSLDREMETDYYDFEEEETLKKALEILEKEKDSRIYEIFKLRYFGGLKVTPWRKINTKIKASRKSSKGHITIQACINLHNKGINILRKKFETNAG